MAFDHGGHSNSSRLSALQPSQNDSRQARVVPSAHRRSRQLDEFFPEQESESESEGPAGSDAEFSPHDFLSHESRGSSDGTPENEDFATELVTWAVGGAEYEDRATAMERISNCLLNRNTVLDLSGLSLENLPYSCFENLSHIERLDLSFNEISDIEDLPFSRLSNLEQLNVKSNLLEEIPVAITLCTSLRYLNITDNPKEETRKCIVPEYVKFVQQSDWPCEITED